MLFHVRMDVHLPLDMDPAQSAELKATEKAYSQALQHSGKWRHIWRIAGDYRAAVLGAVNYGRDCDSIATMAGAICAGLGGMAVIPAEWADEVAQASRIDLVDAGRRLAVVAGRLATADAARAERTLEVARARAAALQGATL